MFKRIYFFFITYLAAMYFSQLLIVLWLFKNGFGLTSLMAYYLVAYIVSLIGIFLLRNVQFSAKKAMFFGIIFSALMALTLIKIYSPVQLYISAIASGLNVIFFWIPYNSMHFKFSRDSKRGLNSGIYFMITPILGVTLQPLAGVIGEKFGFATVFAIGVLLYLIPLFLLRTLPDFKWNTDVRKEFFAKKFNWSIFMQGFVWRINASLVPIFTLFFIKTPREFGNFFGYLAIAAAVASLLNAYFSDKLKSRKHFFYIFSAIAVLSFLPLAFAQNAYYWGIFAGVASLCLYLANPFWLAYNLDEYKDIPVEKTMVLREIFLNLGYVTALIVAMLLFYTTGSFKIALAITCLFALLMPILSYFQGVYRNK